MKFKKKKFFLMKLILKLNKTALYMAVEKDNYEIVKYLLKNKNILINAYSIFNKIIFFK